MIHWLIYWFKSCKRTCTIVWRGPW